jgi:hypothetical protein
MDDQYYRVVILRDLVNSIDEIAEGLINHVPGLICTNRDWYRSRNMHYARKMAHLARVYGSAVVAETTDKKKALEVHSFLLCRGLRLLPFGDPLPECDIDRTELAEIAKDSRQESPSFNDKSTLEIRSNIVELDSQKTSTKPIDTE